MVDRMSPPRYEVVVYVQLRRVTPPVIPSRPSEPRVCFLRPIPMTWSGKQRRLAF